MLTFPAPAAVQLLSRPFEGRAVLAILLCCALSVTGCSEDKTPQTDAADAAEQDSAGPNVDANSDTCPPPPVKAGQVRARKLACKADLPTGIMASARIGDLVLENSMARFVIRAGAEGEAIIGLVGGNVIDAVALDKDGQQTGTDSLREWVPTVAFHLVQPTKLEIAADGSDGAARVTVAGDLVQFPTIQAFLSLDKPPVTTAHEYVLRPDSSALEIRTTVTPTDGKDNTALVGDVTLWSGEMGLYRPGSGGPDSEFDAEGKALVLGLTPLRADPALMPAACGFSSWISIIDAAGILAFLQPPKAIPPAGKTFVRQLVIGGNSGHQLADAMATAGSLAGAKHSTLAGKVAGMWLGVEVELLDKKGKPLTRCTPDAKGAFSCPAPADTAKARTLWVGNGEGQGGDRGQVTPAVDVKPGEAAKLTAPKPAKLTVKVRTADGQPTAFQIKMLPTKDIAAAGDRTFIDGDGDATFTVPPGTWTVWIHHGPEWSAHTQKITLKADETGQIDTKLSHVVDTTGWIACDTHIHAEHSVDSEVPNRERVLDAIAVGLDYAVATDHDFVTDYSPWLKAMGLTDRITVASGVEVSTAKFGHHGVWPLTPDPAKSGRGAIAWHGKDGVGLAKALRGGLPKSAPRMVQVNHPRGSQSYFQGIGFDPKDAAKTDKKLLDFDAIELMNSKRMSDTDKVVTDWFALLNEGIKPTGMGTSDTHSLSSGVGSARTLVWVGKDKAGKGRDQQGVFTAAEADAAIKAGKAVATTGPLLVFTLNSGDKGSEKSAAIGEKLGKATGEIEAQAILSAPEWMPLGKVELYRNGLLVHTEDVSEAEVKDGARVVTVSFKAPAATKDGWWTAMHKPGTGAQPPIQNRPVWAITNPVYESK
ncbi:MAG: PHP domain-containing protein [Myxococcales bacterium]|nr:PHP domain-containing protein [Myxococcales bacterium]